MKWNKRESIAPGKGTRVMKQIARLDLQAVAGGAVHGSYPGGGSPGLVVPARDAEG